MSSEFGVAEEKILALKDYETSPLYSAAERAALRYADAITLSDRDVSDELFAELREFYDEDQVIELTAAIAWENSSSKFNRALRIDSQALWKQTQGSRNCATTGDPKPRDEEPDMTPDLEFIIKSVTALCDEYGEYSRARPSEFPPDSPISVEMATSVHRASTKTAARLSHFLLEVILENLSLFAISLTDRPHPIASLSTLRPVLEFSATVCWLLADDIQSDTRVGRVFGYRYEELNQQLRVARAFDSPDSEITPITDRISKVERDAIEAGFNKIRNSKNRRDGIAVRMPPSTSLLKECLGLSHERLYRVLSGVSHGHTGIIRQLSFEPAPDEDQTDTEGGKVFAKEPKLDILNWAAFSAVQAAGRATWLHWKFCGQDLVPIEDIFARALRALRSNQDTAK